MRPKAQALTGSLFLAVALLRPAAATAQIDTASIVGTVTDTSGAVLPGVTLTATQDGTGFTSTATTNWNDATNYWRTYLVVTSAGGAVSSFEDHRDLWGQIVAAATPTIAREIQVACSDETTPLTTGTAKVRFRAPRAMTVTGVRASLTTAQAGSGGGGIFTVDINEAGTTILSTKITIDNTEKTSTTAATPAVVSDTAIADDAEITIDIDQIGDGSATGLKVTILYT